MQARVVFNLEIIDEEIIVSTKIAANKYYVDSVDD